MHLSAEQLAVVVSPLRHKKVVAGAGSGKTKVLVEQIHAWIDLGVEPEKITVVTFTRRAAMEIRRRLGPDGGKLHHLGTITGFAYRKLWEAGKRYALLDDFELGLVIEHVALQAKRRRHLRPKVVARIVMDGAYEKESDTDRALAAMTLAYMKRHRLLHVSSVLCRFLRFMLEGGNMRASAFAGARAVLWDEFQDSSALELRILAALDPGRSLIIGDPRQSIYQWRGAIPENIEAAPGAAFHLRDNWRSAREIVAFGNGLPAAKGYQEQAARREEPGRVYRIADFVAEDFYTWLVSHAGPATVLCRTNREIAAIEQALAGTALTVRVAASAFDEYATAPWRRLWAAARLLCFPDNEWLQLRCPLSSLGRHASPGGPVLALAKAVGGVPLDDRNLGGTVLDWLSWYAARDVQDLLPDDEEPADILLMTVHGAKGLEWPTVAMHSAGRLEGAKGPEEQNILYVGATRARERLFLLGGAA